MNDSKVIASITDLLSQVKNQVASLQPEMLRIKIGARINAIILAMTAEQTKPVAPIVTKVLPVQPIPADYVPTAENATKGRCCS